MAADAECASELTRTVVPEENNCLPFLKPGSCQTSQCTSVSRTTPEYIQRGLHESSERRRISDAVATETSNSVVSDSKGFSRFVAGKAKKKNAWSRD